MDFINQKDSKFTTIVFDLGGVVFRLEKQQAIDHFKEIGFEQVEDYLDDYEQKDFFGDLESGIVDAEQFRARLSELSHRPITLEQCEYAWTGYIKEKFDRNFEAFKLLREAGYRLCLLSNTNPFMMHYVRSDRFDGHGHGIGYYMDALYLSYEMRVMKPSSRIFEMMLERENVDPSKVLFLDDSARNCAAANALGIATYQPVNGEDWAPALAQLLRAGV